MAPTGSSPARRSGSESWRRPGTRSPPSRLSGSRPRCRRWPTTARRGRPVGGADGPGGWRPPLRPACWSASSSAGPSGRPARPRCRCWRRCRSTLDASKQQEGTAELLGGQGGQGQELRVDTSRCQPAAAMSRSGSSTPTASGWCRSAMSSTQGTFPIPPNAIEQGYKIVDLSREQFDDKPQRSGDSVMRGTCRSDWRPGPARVVGYAAGQPIRS